MKKRFWTWWLAILGTVGCVIGHAAYHHDRHTRHMVLGIAYGAIGGWNIGTILRPHRHKFFLWLRHACEIDWLSWICAAFAVFGFLVWLAGVMQ